MNSTEHVWAWCTTKCFKKKRTGIQHQPIQPFPTLPSTMADPSSYGSSSVFDGCTDSCGWIAALVSAVAYGSFGVPIKETNSIPDAHPLVLQSYKSATMFVASWLVLFLGVAPSFTPWGLASGTLWVLGGTGGIYAIRAAGMAVAVGTWASVMVAVNFVWGILVFHEPVSSLASTIGAFALLALGLVGMSHFAAPQPDTEDDGVLPLPTSSPPPSPGGSSTCSSPLPGSSNHSSSTSLLDNDGGEGGRTGLEAVVTRRIRRLDGGGGDRDDMDNLPTSTTGDGLFWVDPPVVRTSSSAVPSTLSPFYILTEQASKDKTDDDVDTPWEGASRKGTIPTDLGGGSSTVGMVRLWGGITVSRRTAGILGAIFNGLATGSSLIPLHYAKEQGYGGANYLISFASGGLLANAGVWILFAAYCYWRTTSTASTSASAASSAAAILPRDDGRPILLLSERSRLRQTYASLPSWHVRELWLPGCLAGACFAPRREAAHPTNGRYLQCQTLTPSLVSRFSFPLLAGSQAFFLPLPCLAASCR